MKTIDDVFAKEWKLFYPRAIQLETSSLCNSHCTYCPYDSVSKIFPKSRISEDLFINIINQVKHFQPQLFAPYMNNEPFADKHFLKRLKIIRDALPNTFIDIATNGSLLTEELSQELLSPEYAVDEIKINFPTIIKEEYEKLTSLNYDLTLDRVIKFINIAQKVDFKGRYRIVMVDSKHLEIDVEFWRSKGIPSNKYAKVSRGGIIDTGLIAKNLVNGCKYNRQNEWMHILSNGLVVLCCMDWHRQQVLGDLNNQSIDQVWNSNSYQAIRKRISNSEDKSFICNNCEWGITYEK
ncbi:TPA: radical SAM/SPASM domain-containing protein [Candidatus Woesearchaeota archaeon]|nr:radical SAM/SPASM domain-containing protein [Candidatus Woesearchaeota archaeon]HIH12803.1 radical SAM/SPASM domain-containing protein [Candidatus Woesearchaeota archaeon]